MTRCSAFCTLVSILACATGQTTHVKCSFTAEVERSYSPKGVDRFLELVSDGFFTDMLLYRVIPGFLVQFGVAADPKVQAKWQDARIPDEPNQVNFKGGTLSFAGAGENSRSCHLFVALSPNGNSLGKAKHETTLGHIKEVEVFEKVASNFRATGYPDTGSLQGALVSQGNAAAAKYPKLDRILQCAVVPSGQAGEL